MKKNVRTLVAALLIAAVFVALLSFGLFTSGEALAQMSPSRTVFYLDETQVLTTTTPTARFLNGVEIWGVADDYSTATIFLTVDVDSSEVVTVTPQYSADGVNWANAAEFVPDWTNGQIDTVPITLVANADGTSYKRFNLNGPLIRFSMIAATGPVTTTMLVVYE